MRVETKFLLAAAVVWGASTIVARAAPPDTRTAEAPAAPTSQPAESKAELTRRAIPYVTVEGTRGGAALAAAALNALGRLALV